MQYLKKIQRLTLVLLLREGELNVREVPEVTEPVLVTESEGLADREAKAMSSEGRFFKSVGKAYQEYRGRNL
jgi:hypothetical protein